MNAKKHRGVDRRRLGAFIVPLLVLAIVFPIANAALPSPAIVHDAYGYAMTAQRLVRHGYFAYSPEDADVEGVPPNAVVTPGWPLVLAGVYALSGDTALDPQADIRAAQGVQRALGLLLSLAIVAAIALSGRHLGGDPLGMLAGLMAALYLPFSWGATVSLSEHLGAALLAWAIYVALRLTAQDARRRLWHALGFGALLAALFLVRPNLLLWMAVPFLYVAVRRLESMRRLALLLAAGSVGFVLVMSPWWARNAVALGMWVPVKTDTIPGADGRVSTVAGLGTESLPFAEGAWVPTTALQAARIAMRPWIPYADVLFENTYHYDKLRIDLPGSDRDAGAAGSRIASFATGYHAIVMVLLLISLAFVRRSPRIVLLLAVPIAVLLVHGSHLVLRYMYPTMPAAVLAAAVGGYGAYRWLRGHLRAA